MKQEILDQPVNGLIDEVAKTISLAKYDWSETVIVGVLKGGKKPAQLIKAAIESQGHSVGKLGYIDITFYRDDLAHSGFKGVLPSVIPDINNKHVILVDDVLKSGRTIRSALDALNDFGRPKSIALAVLIDRGHRELPISANFTGCNISTTKNDLITVSFNEDIGTIYITRSDYDK
jgi:pyrimidine operon attenuation protein / uracil phosphoribosyltransferase